MDELELLTIDSSPTSSIGTDVTVARRETINKFLGSGFYVFWAFEKDLVERFNTLKQQWIDDTHFKSNVFSTTSHPAYLQILSYGQPMIPILLNDMKENRTHWFFALSDLTGAHPIREENRGKVDRMIEDWVVWGEHEGYL